MDKKIIEQIKNNLLKEKKKLEKSLKNFAKKNIYNDYNTVFPDYGDEEDENVGEVATFSDNLSLEHSLEKSLKDVNEALERIENGNYGICRYCGKKINEQRLLVRPVSGACIECKTKLTE